MKHGIDTLRTKHAYIIVAGNHPAIVQSILDFDFLSGRDRSILAIVTGGKKAHKCFWGEKEMLLPCVSSFSEVQLPYPDAPLFLLNLQSGRKTKVSTDAFFRAFPEAVGAHLFAENVPEAHAHELLTHYGDKLIAGPSGVGLLVPGALKLGAVGGVSPEQFASNRILSEGSVAVISTSGGMTGELIHAVGESGKGVSFALCIGGERFPTTSLRDVLLLAEHDPKTKGIAYFGELGGVDEYDIVELMSSQKLTKPVVAYIAGVIDESFTTHFQFGHAKALVAHKDESARAKRHALREAGAAAPETFTEFVEALKNLPGETVAELETKQLLRKRVPSILSTRAVQVPVRDGAFVQEDALVEKDTSFSAHAAGALFGKPITSPITKAFIEAVTITLLDHGGSVSGAVNTMITARAGKGLVESLVAGLLTIGPRFGGAINDAARLWHSGVKSGADPRAFVEEATQGGNVILGIGHKKYRVGLPDPRVSALSDFTKIIKKHPYYDFARAVEAVTTGKNGSLILNVDGLIGALMLDVLAAEEGYSSGELLELIETEALNGLFILARSAGFMAHAIEQKRYDEGLFRLPEHLLYTRGDGELTS